MPQRINMLLSNGNNISPQVRSQINPANIANVQSANVATSLNSPIIARVHNVKPGCSSCGKH
jgi:hypothetical protein